MEQPERKLDLKRAVSINEALDMVPDTHLAPLVEYIEQLEKELDERDAPTRHNTIAEIERVTKERDVYKASWEQLTVEKAQSSWGEFQRQSKMLKEAQAEVERLKLHMQDYHQMHDRERDLRIAAEEKLLLSDVTLQFVSVALGGPDEWSTHETMISSVRRTAEAAKAEVERLKKESEIARATPAPDPEIEGLVERLKVYGGDWRMRAGDTPIYDEAASALTTMAGELREANKRADFWRARGVKFKDATKDAESRVAELTAEIEKLTKERDDLIVEKSQSSWGEFQRQGRMLKDAQAEVAGLTKALDQSASARDALMVQRDELEAQVKRLLANEGERIGDQLRERVE